LLYIVISHSPAYTAQGIAALVHIPGKELAKTVMVKMDSSLVADEGLAKDEEIAFNAASHRELIRLAWEDFEKLVKPKVIRFAAGTIAETAA
jgi:prolyl-tRNA editing enzyme YbaK/EbsC (Cys-tRNA(Pro) deacylase)